MVSDTPSLHPGVRAVTHALGWFADLGTAWGFMNRSAAGPAGDRARYHLGRARRAYDRGDYGKAADEATKSLRLDHRSSGPLIVLGRSALAESRVAEAVDWLEMALERSPHNTYALDLIVEACQRAGMTGRGEQTLTRAAARGTPVRRWTRRALASAA